MSEAARVLVASTRFRIDEDGARPAFRFAVPRFGPVASDGYFKDIGETTRLELALIFARTGAFGLAVPFLEPSYQFEFNRDRAERIRFVYGERLDDDARSHLSALAARRWDDRRKSIALIELGLRAAHEGNLAAVDAIVSELGGTGTPSAAILLATAENAVVSIDAKDRVRLAERAMDMLGTLDPRDVALHRLRAGIVIARHGDRKKGHLWIDSAAEALFGDDRMTTERTPLLTGFVHSDVLRNHRARSRAIG